MDVAQSKTKSKCSSVGKAKVKGLVPNIFSTPNVGAIDGRALVPQIPNKPCLLAMVAQ